MTNAPIMPPIFSIFFNALMCFYLDRLLNKLLAEADYSKDKQIALWASSDDQSYINSIYSLSLGWDSDKKKRVIMEKAIF